MNPIVQLLESRNEDDLLIARAILLHKYREGLKEYSVKIFNGLYVIGFLRVEKILGERINVDLRYKLVSQLDFTYDELFKD